MRVLVELVIWWWVAFGTFWLSGALIAVPYSATGVNFDLSDPKRKLVISAIVAAAQAVICWVWLTWMWRDFPGAHPPFRVILYAASMSAGVVLVAFCSPLTGDDHWEELGWIATVQMFVIWFGCAWLM